MKTSHQSVLAALVASALALAITMGGAGAAASAASVTWSSPVDLSPAAVASSPAQIATDSSGLATAVWVRNNGTSRVIQARTSQNGGAWSNAVDVSLNGGDASDPRITVSQSGLATIVWIRFDGSNNVVQASTSQSGLAFSTPQNVSLPGGEASGARIATSASGLATAVWDRFDGSHQVVQSSRSQSGLAFSTPQNVSLTDADALSADIAVSATGLATAVWYWLNGGNSVVEASTAQGEGAWSTPRAVSQINNDWTAPKVTVDPTGLATVVWTRSNGSNIIVQASRSLAGGAFAAPVDLSTAGNDASNPQVTVSDSGLATAVWSRFNGATHVVQASTAQDAGIWSTAADLSSLAYNALDPHLAVSPTGLVTVIWKGTSRVQFSSSQGGGAWSTPADVSPGTLASAMQIAVDSFGLITAVWLSILPGNVVQSSTFQGAVVLPPAVPGVSAPVTAPAVLANTGTDLPALGLAGYFAVALLITGLALVRVRLPR